MFDQAARVTLVVCNPAPSACVALGASWWQPNFLSNGTRLNTHTHKRHVRNVLGMSRWPPRAARGGTEPRLVRTLCRCQHFPANGGEWYGCRRISLLHMRIVGKRCVGTQTSAPNLRGQVWHVCLVLLRVVRWIPFVITFSDPMLVDLGF